MSLPLHTLMSFLFESLCINYNNRPLYFHSSLIEKDNIRHRRQCMTELFWPSQASSTLVRVLSNFELYTSIN